MSDFLRTLSTFQGGSVSRDQLLAEVDRQLAGAATDPVMLLASLEQEPARTALPRELHDAIAEKILRSLGFAATGADFSDPEPSDTLLNCATEVSVPRAPATPQSESRSVSALFPGMLLKGRFELVECLGEGGMGRVYKAIDLRRVEARSQDVYVAVKVLTRSFSDLSFSLAVLQREALKLQRLPHPNIVRVIDCDRDGSTVFMIMEYLGGQSLKQKLNSPSVALMTREQSLQVLEQIADALSFAHRNDVVHGDLKPGNVIIGDSGEAKVIDFGITRAIDSYDSLSAMTPSYASPEMLERKAPDPRDDVYAFACIAYEVLTGKHPFERKSAIDARDAGLKVVKRDPLSRNQLKAIARALRFDREKRTPSINRFMREFRGERSHSNRRIVAIAAGAIALIAAAAAYFINRTQADSGGAALSAGQLFRDCDSCPLMKVIGPGEFQQGSAVNDPHATDLERPQHLVFVAHALAFGVQEVTRAQFREFVEATGRDMSGCASYDGSWRTRPELSWSNVGYAQSAAHPAVCVSWQDAKAYAEWLSNKTGYLYRLPSASEWEYAARAGSQVSQPLDSDAGAACTSANVADEAAAQHFSGWEVHTCNDGYVYTAPVGAFAPNAFGLSDMLGNAFEWVQDCWHANYEFAPTDGSAYQLGDCTEREMRGGSWFTSPAYVRAAYRNRFEDNYRSNSIGFRVVRELGP
jgi:formylglycine-generating enzyme required for sulfatase activity